jgi:nicrotizing toxin Mtb-like protein
MGIQLPPELSAVAAQAGVRWPQADEDQLRAQATAWRDAGGKLTNLTRDADHTASGTLHAVSGTTGDAAHRHWSTFVHPDTGHLTATARGCTSAADRLDHAANQVGAAKVEIVRNLVSLAKNSDAAHQAAGAGNPNALLGLNTAVQATNANVNHITNSLATAVVPATGVDMNTVQPLVNPNPGQHGPLDTVSNVAAQVGVDPRPGHPDITGPVRIPPVDHGPGGMHLPVDAPTPPAGIPVAPGQTVLAGLAGGGVLDPSAAHAPPAGSAPGGFGSGGPGAGGPPGQGFPAGSGFPGGPAAGGPVSGGGPSAAVPAGPSPVVRPAAGVPGAAAGPAAQGGLSRLGAGPVGGEPAAGPGATARPGGAGPPAASSAGPPAASPGATARPGAGPIAGAPSGPAAPVRPGLPAVPVVDGQLGRGSMTTAVPPGPQQQAPPPAAPLLPPKERRDDGVALFWVHMFPIGHMPVVSDRPARQLPAPPTEVDFAPGLRFLPGDHPRHELVHALPGELVPVEQTEGLQPEHPTVAALAEGHDPLGGQHEREWDRRYLVRLGSVTPQGISSAGKEYAWPPGESYPEGGSAAGEPEILSEGTVIDRFGSPRGRVFSLDGTGFANRSLPPEHLDAGYRRYRVLRAVPVWRAVSAPWFGQPGGGERYRATYSATELVALGYLEDVT